MANRNFVQSQTGLDPWRALSNSENTCSPRVKDLIKLPEIRISRSLPYIPTMPEDVDLSQVSSKSRLSGRDSGFIIQQIDNKARNIFKSFCRHFFTSLFLPTYEATYTAGYLLPTDDRYREHHDHIDHHDHIFNFNFN